MDNTRVANRRSREKDRREMTEFIIHHIGIQQLVKARFICKFQFWGLGGGMYCWITICTCTHPHKHSVTLYEAQILNEMSHFIITYTTHVHTCRQHYTITHYPLGKLHICMSYNGEWWCEEQKIFKCIQIIVCISEKFMERFFLVAPRINNF